MIWANESAVNFSHFGIFTILDKTRWENVTLSFVCAIKSKFFLLSPLPPFQCCFKKQPKACTVFCITLPTLVWGEGGRTKIFCECQMMLKIEFSPRVLSKIVASCFCFLFVTETWMLLPVLRMFVPCEPLHLIYIINEMK